MALTDVQPVIDVLASVKDGRDDAIIQTLKSAPAGCSPELVAALFRLAIFHVSKDPLYYRKVWNLWQRSGKPELKPATAQITVEILADGTVDAVKPYLELFLAAYGVAADISIAPYDTVESEAFAGRVKDFDLSLVILSERWLRKSVSSFPASIEDVTTAKETLGKLATSLAQKRSGVVAFTNFYNGAWPAPAGTAAIEGHLPWSTVIGEINNELQRLSGTISVIDLQQALHLAGGASAAGALSMIRMRSPLEEGGFVAVGREVATCIAHQIGKSHRALLTDWDNTLWGGEVGETGSEGIELGPETPDGFGYQLLQSYIRDVNSLGVALATVSRNDPKVAGVLEENRHMRLRRDNFAALELSWGNKSDAVGRLKDQLNFGTDFMLYIDDNHVDLAEVISHFPYIDVVLAGPDPDQSLQRLSGARFFNSYRLTSGDLNRRQQMKTLRHQREASAASSSKEEFLASLDIKITVEDVNDRNRDRVLQLLQKTNQFNLTTRRHQRDDLERLAREGAKFGVFEYEDRFGSQGIIGFMIVSPAADGSEIDTWLMSCRVLNREVEGFMLGWAKQVAGSGKLTGAYIPTEKNNLVSGLYRDMGFRHVGGERYELEIGS
ncbi:HAD family hydrolase [Rhizobium sp. BK377]|uniref:HAD-IIIC family phosphatase n=1 Tax=Rhizobium sp. BK377 TaxID=2587058 RepID=UPI00160C8887|nr:HAD-IIIC family phosphatase [Rhizobium sp. BK377]MBB3463085.1 FkbH-like protein [Rhizobium sp. BK377]